MGEKRLVLKDDFMYNLSKIVASYIIANLTTNYEYKQYYPLSIIGGNFSNSSSSGSIWNDDNKRCISKERAVHL
jgi:hypothetical protein